MEWIAPSIAGACRPHHLVCPLRRLTRPRSPGREAGLDDRFRVTGVGGVRASLSMLPLKPIGLRFSPPVVPTAAAAVLLALLCSLGFWQLDRAAGKETALMRFEAARATVLDATALGRGPVEFARVVLGGRYDPVHQFLQDNRTHQGRSGYHVLTPFRTSSHGAVLVNRGWVPASPDRSSLPEITAPRGTVRLQGMVRLAREDLFVLGDTGYSAPGWPRVVQRVELDAMQRALGYPLAGWLVALDPAAPNGYVREWKAAPGLTADRHRGYAFQWFALAAALFAIWVAVNVKRSGR